MADKAAEQFCAKENYIKSSLEFEIDLKNRLNWNRKQWNEAGECGNRLNKLCSSLKYWSKKLKPACEEVSLVFTVFNIQKDVKTDLAYIVSIIESFDKNIHVQGISEFRNPRYVCFYFRNKEERDFIKQNFKMVDESYVVNLSWALEGDNNSSTVTVHWLPMTLDIENIKNQLSKYVKCVSDERKFLNFMSGRNMPSGKVSFKVELNKGVSAEVIPHLMVIGGMEALVTVSGRLPQCLNCDVLGHISKQCKLRYCASCSALKLKDHLCLSNSDKQSYAQILKNNVSTKDSADPDDWGAAFVVVEKGSFQDEQVSLSQKIQGLENRLKEEKLEPLTSTPRRDDAKRKATIDGFEGAEGERANVQQIDDIDIDLNQNSDFSDSDAIEVDYPVGEDIGTQNRIEETDNKRKKKNVISKKEGNKVRSKLGSVVMKGSESVTPLRSYGKPIANNARKLRENAKFDKLLENREFVFKE